MFSRRDEEMREGIGYGVEMLSLREIGAMVFDEIEQHNRIFDQFCENEKFFRQKMPFQCSNSSFFSFLNGFLKIGITPAHIHP